MLNRTALIENIKKRRN